MGLDEIAKKSAETTFLEGFMADEQEGKHVDTNAWRASLQNDGNIRRLAVGAIIVSEMRKAVLKETQFTCSAGIAHNKVRGFYKQMFFRLHDPFFCRISRIAEQNNIKQTEKLNLPLENELFSARFQPKIDFPILFLNSEHTTLCFNPFTSDQDIISSYNINTISTRKVIRIKQNVNQGIIN